jgi:branched-subunit amino acid aminotransferase/4-amino-4-deoxychorismate lyase
VPTNDLLARHKTDWRTLYDAERAHWSARGADEVLFLNEKDELAEGGISNVFLTLEGRLITPPLSSGALDGVLRRSLIERGVCAEETITLAMLARAESLWFGNALRGLVRAVPLTPA